jgi:hypothetical protein
MTNELKLQTLKEQEYTDFLLEITEENGTIMVNCYHDNTKHDINDIEVINYNGQMIPVAKCNLDYNFKKCECCGEWIYLPNDNYIVTGDTNNCFHDRYECMNGWVEWCDYHECYEQHDDFTCVHSNYGNDEYWCNDAVENHAFFSDYNDEWYDDRVYDCITVYDCGGREIFVTGDQASDNYYWCEQCENYYTYDAYNFDHECCYGCYEENSGSDLINRYHYSKDNGTLHFYGESKYVNPVGLGFELEVDTSYSNAKQNQGKLLRALKERYGDRITFESDGSLENGFEIISAPHTKSEMDLVDWGELMKLCVEHGYRSHDTYTCGLHFHISGYMFGATKEKQYDTIAKVIAFYEYYFEDFIKLSRRNDYQWERWADSYNLEYLNDMADYKSKCEYIVNRQGYGDRYHAINLTNFDYGTKLYKTVEFRINKGTLNIDTFNATWDLLVTLIKNAKKVDWNDSDFFNPKKWLRGCKANTYAYIVKRHAFDGVFYLVENKQETEYTQENA